MTGAIVGKRVVVVDEVGHTSSNGASVGAREVRGVGLNHEAHITAQKTLPAADSNALSHMVLGLDNFTSLQLMDHLRQAEC